MKHLVLLATALALAGCGGKRYQVPTSAMEPTIPKNSKVVVDHNAYQDSSPARWDVVSFEVPRTAGGGMAGNMIWIMRVLGLPGEEIDYGGSEILINGEPLPLPDHLKHLQYLGLDGMTSKPTGKEARLVLPSDAYFVVGDNSMAANDSRTWGPVPAANINGKMVEP